MSNKKDLAKHLFSLWKILFGLFSVGTSIYIGYLQGILGVDVQTMPSIFQIILIAIIGFIFIPLLLLIRKCATQNNVSDISSKSSKLLLALGIASVGTLICNLIAAFAPGVFQ